MLVASCGKLGTLHPGFDDAFGVAQGLRQTWLVIPLPHAQPHSDRLGVGCHNRHVHEKASYTLVRSANRFRHFVLFLTLI